MIQQLGAQKNVNKVNVIQPKNKPNSYHDDSDDNLKRVYAYCRVSTELEQQSSSYELQ